MRLSVLLCDCTVYIPAVFAWAGLMRPVGQTKAAPFGLALALLFHPALVLIDHGHFQYNSIGLGLMIWTGVFAVRRKFCAAGLAFGLALNFKQTGLYFAPAFLFWVIRCGVDANKDV
jgi:alpha-1,3-glucosyltransferase